MSDERVLRPDRELTDAERADLQRRLEETWGRAPAVEWKIYEPRDPSLPPLPLVHTEPLDFDVSYVTEDGALHRRGYQRAHPDAEWRETSRSDLTAWQWRWRRVRAWFADLLERFR